MAIDVVADRAGVGQNLQDHMEVYIQQESLKPITLNSRLGLFSKAMIGAEWLFFKSGHGATNHFESGSFRAFETRRRLSGHPVPFPACSHPLRWSRRRRRVMVSRRMSGRCDRSRAAASTLRSSDPFEKPKILFNYMSHPDDWVDFRHAVRLTREIFGQAALDPYRGREISPGAHVQSDEEIDDFLREHAESAFHPCGTCKMGAASDPDGGGRSAVPGDRRRGTSRCR